MKDNEAKTPEREWRLDISREQYEEMKAKGLDEEALFKPGRHVFRRRDPNKIVSRDNKTVILHLDEETFNYYQRLTDKSDSPTIEEQIEIDLRNLAEKENA